MKNNLLAVDLFPPGGFKGLGTSPLANPGDNAISIFAKFISSAIGIMTIIAFIWFLFLFIIGAISLMTAGGDKQAFENGKLRIRNAIIGIVVVIAAIFIVNLLGSLFGLPNILDVQSLFKTILIK